MFKNATLWTTTTETPIDPQALEEALQAAVFVECGASQEKSAGWISPRNEKNGALLEIIGGQLIVRLMLQSKAVPASAINKELDRRCALTEDQTGRKPGKKERRDMKDDIKLALLPNAFTKESSILAWIDRDNKSLVIDTTTQSRSDVVITALIAAIPGLMIQPVNTKVSPVAAMAQWLTDADALNSVFTIDRDCELKACDESKSVVRYGNHPLDNKEVEQHILNGKMPTRVGMTWNGKISFVLSAKGAIQKMNFLGVKTDESSASADAFDADIVISTGLFNDMKSDLIASLGGEFVAVAETVET